MMPGEDAAPLHPHCRCSVAPWQDSAEYEAWLDYLARGGTTEEWEGFKTEHEQSKPKYPHGHTVVDNNMVESSEYRKKFDNISDNADVVRTIWANAKEMLHHRSGTKYEDLSYVDSKTGKHLMNKDYNAESRAKPSRKMEKMRKAAAEYSIIGIHNHPESNVLSLDDLLACYERKYKYGVVICHNGTIYKYTINNEKFNEPLAFSAIANLEKEGYNDKINKLFNGAGVKLEVF